MIGRSLPEYVFIRLAILGLRLIAPLSVAYLTASWYHGRALLSPWLVTYAAAEAVFYLLVVTPRRRVLQKVRVTPSPPLKQVGQESCLSSQCLYVPSKIGFHIVSSAI